MSQIKPEQINNIKTEEEIFIKVNETLEQLYATNITGMTFMLTKENGRTGMNLLHRFSPRKKEPYKKGNQITLNKEVDVD